MMGEYYAIYDINKQEYFVASGPLVVEWSSSGLLAKWFCSKFAAKMFIRMDKWLQRKNTLCIVVVAKF